MDITLNFDGACEPVNPGGVASFGWIIKRNGATLKAGSGVAMRGPGATNNVAEYTALIEGLRALAGLGLAGEPVEVRGDSMLVIRQMSGDWRIGSERLLPLYRQAQDLAGQFAEVMYRWVPREENAEADALSIEAYNAAPGTPLTVRNQRRAKLAQTI